MCGSQAFPKEDTQQKVIAIISEKLSMPKENITIEATFKDLGADSLDIVELVMAFEEEFGVEIPDDAAEKISTVADAITFINDNKG